MTIENFILFDAGAAQRALLAAAQSTIFFIAHFTEYPFVYLIKRIPKGTHQIL
jgi:hypothetical protein